jgi:hypothetical protein
MLTDSPTTAGGLDWQAFSAAYFPGRGRHDFEALIAYGAYKRSQGADEPTTGGADSAGTTAEEETALEAWEDEGGPAT